MKAFFVVAIASVSFVRAAYAGPPGCHKWHNHLADWEAAGLPTNQAPVGIQKEDANHELYAKSALQACKQYFAKTSSNLINYPSAVKACTFSTTNNNDYKCYPLPGGLADFPQENPPAAWCVYNITSTGDDVWGPINWNDATAIGVTVDFEQVTPDPHCFCEVHGPYEGLDYDHTFSYWEDFRYVFLHAFPSKLKQAIVADNLADGTLSSDAIYANSTSSFDPNPELQKTNPYGPDAAEVDHIIPRVDSHGCLCGDPTPNNAALISRELNASMSNTSPKYDLNRYNLYEKYVTCRDQSAWQYQGPRVPVARPLRLEDLQLDEGTTDVEFRDAPPKRIAYRTNDGETESESGGCSTGGAQGVGCIALALIVLRRRRR